MNPYVEAARPRTLPAAFAPVLVGTAAAATPIPEADPLRFVLALVVALSLQVAVNYANDWFDGVKGVDSAARTGPRRAVASGLVSAAGMRNATFVALGVAAVTGLVLAILVGPELLLVGALAIVAALGYSGGTKPYASLGLGELSVFVFFGLVATAGSAYVQDGQLELLPVLAAIPIGFTSVALLVVNNLRDIPTDEAAGKRTLAVRLGEGLTRRLYQALLVLSVLMVAPIAYVAGSWLPLLGFGALGTAGPAIQSATRVPLGPELVPVLERTAQTLVLFGGFLTIGLAMAG